MKTTDFQFKKKFGQNFLTDTNLLRAICGDAGICENDNVLEIGPGAGALTSQIAQSTKGKVLAVEIDTTLRPILEGNLSKYSNVEVMFCDILRVKKEEIASKFNNQPFRVVANLPYYISTPIIFYLIESGLLIKSITVMLQKELADRICAKAGTKDYGGISVVLGLYGKVQKTRDASRKLFNPQPNVDSSVVHIEIDQNQVQNITQISQVVKMCFAMRRKTLSNNLMQGLGVPRAEIDSILNEIGISPTARAESLEKESYILLTNKLQAKNLLK